MFAYADELYEINRITVDGCAIQKIADGWGLIRPLGSARVNSEIFTAGWGKVAAGYCAEESSDSIEMAAGPDCLREKELDPDDHPPGTRS